MRRRRLYGLAAFGAAAALTLAACSSGGSSSSSGGGNGSGAGAAAAFNAGVTSVVNPSTHKGGTLTFDWRAAPDSFDPGNTYYAADWDFARFYSTALMTYKNCPGACGKTLVPALATAPGRGQRQRADLDLSPQVRRQVPGRDPGHLPGRQVRGRAHLRPRRAAQRPELLRGPAGRERGQTYPGPYKDRSKNLMGLTAIDTPDATTVVFHLKAPFSDFDYLLTIPQTAPVPPDKDTGASYQTHIVSTGPYKFQSYQLNKTAVLVPNPQWNASMFPTVSQLPSKIVVNMNMNPNDVDNRLLAGDAQVDFAGTGVQAAARAKILANPTLKAQSDDPITGFGWFFYIDSQVAPFTNLACRQAIEYATNHLTLQNAYGGPVAGGAIGSTVMPPTVAGYQKLRPVRGDHEDPGRPGQGQAAAADLRPAERFLHRARLPQRPAHRDPGRPGPAAGAVGGRNQGHAARLPERRRTSATSRACRST